MEITLIKKHLAWVPFDPTTEEFTQKKKIGTVIHADFKQSRNPAFHRKGMALLHLAYSYWEPGELSNKHGKVEKNFKQFRKDLTILAGFYEQHFRVDGTFRVVAKSLSFGSMEEEDFSKWYQAILTVIYEKIMPTFAPETIEQMANEFWEFV